jgi:C-terminal processing protease CtpA/Prc
MDDPHPPVASASADEDDGAPLTEKELQTAVVVPVSKAKGKRFGMEVRTTKRKGSRILKVARDGLAFESGLKPGDVIIRINDEDIVGWSHARVGGYLRSKPVDTLTVLRAGL